MLDYLVIIQARLGSKRFPNKVMETVGGVPMVRRVWLAARLAFHDPCRWRNKIIVAWPERYPDLDENDVLGRFKRLSKEFPSRHIVRLTADCPCISGRDIYEAVKYNTEHPSLVYYNNGKDGHDVQVFTPEFMLTHGHREHVVNMAPNIGGSSVNTRQDLERVRAYAR